MYSCAEICQHSGQPSAGEHNKYEHVYLIVFVKLVVLVVDEYAVACCCYSSSLTAASARAATSGGADDHRPGRCRATTCRGDSLNVNTAVSSSSHL